MKCEKCGGEWVPPKTISVSLTNCPFCNAPLLNAEVANSYTEMGDFLCYLVSLYGADLYGNRQKLNDLISDLYRGDDRMKRAYRRAILDESLPQRIHALSLKPKTNGKPSATKSLCNSPKPISTRWSSGNRLSIVS